MNPNIVLTYPFYNPELSKEQMDVEIDLEMSEILYQTNLLQCFNMTDFNLNEINMKIQDLFEGIPKEYYQEKAIQLAQIHCFTDDVFTGFMLLFSYDYFYIVYPLLSNFIKNGIPFSLKNIPFNTN